ncbi:MAG: hypothetical protein WBD00_07825 [Candidatus Omnitrophota bacterium]
MERTRQRILFRVVAVITLICFISYDFAWAYPSSRPSVNTLAQQTLLTSDDTSDSIARATAKYLELVMSKDFRNMPLAGVQEMLDRIRKIASEQLDQPSIRVEGGAEEGQVFVRISDDCVLRYFNPRMTGLVLPDGITKVAWEKTINDYLSCQLLKKEEKEASPAPIKKKAKKLQRDVKTDTIDPIITRIQDVTGSGKKVMVLIDGNPGSGKTTIVARGIKDKISSCKVISIDNYVKPDRTINIPRLSRDLWTPHRKGVQIIVFEGLNLQYSLNELMKMNAGLGGYVYEDMQRSVVSVRTRVEKEEDRIAFLRQSSHSRAVFEARTSIKQQKQYDLIAGYDYIFTRKAREGGADEDEDDTDLSVAPAVLPMSLVANISPWLLIPAFILTILLIDNVKVLVKIYRAKGRLSKYMAEEDAEKKKKLMFKWNIQPKEGRLSIVITRGVRVFTPRGFSKTGRTETLYLGRRMFFIYFPVRILLALKKKKVKAEREKQLTAMLEDTLLLSNMNFKDLVARVGATQGLSTKSVSTVMTHLRSACMEMCRVQDDGYNFIKVPQAKALDSLKVGSDKKRLGTVLLHKEPNDLLGLYKMLSALAASVNVLDPKPADAEELYLLLVAIRDFSDEDAKRERARLETEAKPLWERMIDEKLKQGIVRKPVQPANKPQAQPKRTLEPVLIKPQEGPTIVSPAQEQPPQEFVDRRNNILKVFDAVMADDILSRNSFTVAEFMQARQSEFGMGTVVYMLELLGKMGVLCATASRMKPPVYQLDDRFYTLPQDRIEIIRTVLYNLGDEIDPQSVFDTKTYIEKVLWDSKGGGPNPRNYAYGTVPFFPAEVSGFTAFLTVGAGIIALLNLNLCVKILKAKIFLKKYLLEKDPEERRKLEEKAGYNARYQGYNHFVSIARGVVVEVSKDANGKARTETVFFKFLAQLLYLPIILVRGIGRVIIALVVAIPVKNAKLLMSIVTARKEWKKYLLLPEGDHRRVGLNHDIKKDSRGYYKHIAPGIHVYGWKAGKNRVKVDVRVRNLGVALWYSPLGLVIWIRQFAADTLARCKNNIREKKASIANIMKEWREAREKKAKNKRLRDELKKNELFNTPGMEIFLDKAVAYTFYPDLVEKLGVVSVNISLLLKDGYRTFTITEPDGRVPWNTIELEKGLTVKKALDSGKEVNFLKVARLLHKKLGNMNFEYFEVEKMWEIYHILIMIKGLGARETDTPKQRKSRIDRIFPNTLLSILVLLLLPFTAFAAPANLSYTYHSPSGYIETETYLDDWDGDTPADPSDDVPAGTVVHRIDEAFYDNGTPVNLSDDYGRPDRKTHPDGSYEEYEYYTGTDNIHYIRGYTSGGSPVFVYETISATFAIKTYTSGAGASYHLDSGNQYVNAERDTDGTIRTYEYDGSWNLTEMMAYHPDGRQDRHDYIQEVVEELTPGWKFYRGANLPWLKYGYDIGDGVNGETYEGLNTKRAQLLQQLNRFKGSAVRVFIFCDLRSGVTFDGGGTPTGLSTHVFDDMDALVEAAQVLGIRLIPVVLDYMIADNINMEGPNPVGEYPDLITDNAKRAALINVIRPFIQRYAGRPEIEMWDVLNEPIEITTSTSLTVAQVQIFITDFINMIHAEDSGSRVTIGAQSRQILLDNWTGLGQDIDQAHYYDYMVPWYPLTDDISTWGSGLTSFGFFFGELEPTGVSGKLDDIYGSAVDGGGLFWQDTTGFTITDPQADTIRHWYDSAAQRPFPPDLVSVTDSNGSRTFTVTWQPYTGALAGSVTGYTINIGGETFYIAGAGTFSAVIDLPDHIYSGTYNLSIRTEVPDPQRDSDYSTPVTISAGQSPDEGRSGGSCSMADGKMSSNSIFGTLIPYLLLVTVLLLLRHGHRTRREEKEESEEEDSEMPESMAKKKKRRPASGNVLDGFNTVMANKDFRESVFTSITFGPCRLNEDGNPFSYRTIKSELDGMVALGILNAGRPSEPFEPIEFTLTERYRRAGKHLDSIRKVLDLLSPRPSEEELVWVKAKLDSQVFAEGEDLTYYYLRALPKMNLRLIRLGAERVTLEKELKQDPENADKKEQLEKCQQRIQVLKTEITLEEELITPPDYELKRTGDRDYRAEAKDKMRRAIEMMEKKNEPAASALLRAAKQRFAEELLQLSKTKVKMRGPRVWKDVEDKLHNVLRGQYISHGISADRDVLIKEWIPHRSETIWQGIRSCDREIDNILRERDWVLSIGKRMKEYIDILDQRRRTLPSAKTGEPLPQPEVSDEEKECMRVLLSEITESLKRAQVEEKVITHTACEFALELLDLGEYRSMLEEMMAARSLLRRRHFSLTKQIDKIRTGRLAILREYVRARNSRTIWKLDRILEMFEAGNRQKARDWMMGMTRDNDIKSEPEFHRMLPVLWQAINNIDTAGKENTVRRNIGIMKERVRSMVLLDSFMDGLREKYVDARLQGKAEAYYDRIFTEDFNRYLKFARDNNIGRGSPRLLWTTFYLAAYVSMNMPDPAKPSKKIDSPLFPAMLDLVRMIEADSIPDLTKAIEKKKKKYANVYEILLEYDLKGFTSLDALSSVHWRRFLSALSKDAGLNEEQEGELLKVASVPPQVENLTDVARLDIYWREMWKEYIDTVAQRKLTGDMAERYRQLIGEALNPVKWPGIFEEDWEEGFVKENSALSMDDLAKRFLSHYPGINWFRKDLRKVTAFNGAKATMNDIYTNMLVGLTPGLPPETIKSTKERIWILREWIYRHWNGSPRERSYDVISRTVGMEDISGKLSQDEAVAHIGRYYDEGEGAGRVTGYKHTVGDGHFIASPTGHLKLLSEWLLDENKSALDMGSGTGKAVAVFSRYAGHVKGVENDLSLLAESESCVVDLADIVDNGKIELYYGSLIDEDLSKYDLIYIFWPEYGEDKYRDYVKDRLQEKLLEELKPGAHFVIISATDTEKFSELEEVEPPFTVPDVRRLTIYRKPEEPSSSPVETEPKAEEGPSEKDLGAEVSDISAFNRLESILSILRDKKGMAFSGDVVEAWLRYLDKRGLTEREFKDGTWIVTIKDETVDYIDKTTVDEKLAVSIMRVARTVRRRVIKPEGGVSAINFKGSDGIWRIVGFQSELNKDVISHELKEVQERRLNPSMHWTEAHNRAVEATGVGVTLDTRMRGISRIGRGEDVGSLFGGRSKRSAGTMPGYLDIMGEHEKLDAEIKRLSKKKTTHLKGAEQKLGKNVLRSMVSYLRKESMRIREEETTYLNAMQGISKQIFAIKTKMDAIAAEINLLNDAGSQGDPSSFSRSNTTVIAGEEAYEHMLQFTQNVDTVRIDEASLDMFLENVYRMAKCLEQLNTYSQTHTLDPRENVILKNINVMMWWLFGAREDNANARVVEVSRVAIERHLKLVTDDMHGFVQSRNAKGAARYLDSAMVIKLLTVQRAINTVRKEIGINETIYKKGHAKMLSTLWGDYLGSFRKMRDAQVQTLRDIYQKMERQYAEAHTHRDSYDSSKTKAVEKRMFIETVANRLDNFSADKDYRAGEKGIFICDVKSPVFSTGQDTHVEVDTSDIYITKEAFEKLIEVDPENMSALAARILRLFGERDLLLAQAVERCNIETGFAHNKLRSLRVELGNAGEDKVKVEDITGRMSKLSREILEMEDENNRIHAESDPAKILDWLRNRLTSTREWVRTIGYMNFAKDYIEFIPNIKFLERILANHKKMIEIEVEMIRTISHPSGHRGALLAGLQEEIDMTVDTLDKGFAVVDHIPDVNLGSLTYTGESRTSYAHSLVGLGFADSGITIGVVLGALAVIAILHEVARQVWIRKRVRGFARRHPVIDGFFNKIFRKSFVPAFISHIICGISGTKLGRVTLKDVLTHSKVPGSPDEAVGLIDRYYQTGENTKTLTVAKATARGGIFTSSKTPDIALVAKAFLDEDKRALDLGSGTAKAVSIFSRYAGYVKGIEQDAPLHAEGEACIRDLSDKMDMSNVELEEGNYFDEDFSQYDLVYIFWPLYHRNVEREMKRRLEDKLVRELKPGALFVINSPMPGGPFSRLEMVDDARFGKTRMLIYRNRPQPEEIPEDFDVGLSEDVFCDLEESVEYGVIEKTEELLAKVNEQSDIKAIALMGQSIKDAEHLNAPADKLIAFQYSVTEWLTGMGLSVDEALELKQSFGEFALNIIEHSKEGIAENERDVFGVIACRARREDDKILIEFFAKDNGIGCDLSGMMRQMKHIKDEGLFLPGGRGIFVAAIPLKNLNEDSLTLISLGKELMFNGIRDANGIPEGVVTSQPGTGSGTTVRMNLKRHIYEDAEEALVESLEADQPVGTEKSRLDIEEIEARFIKVFSEKQDISWIARGHKVHATVVYDEDFENFVVAPETSYREEHPELGVLDAAAAQMFIGPEGSFGQIEVKFEIVDRRPAIVFDEMQASRGYREMTDSKVRERHRKWVESALRCMVNTAKDLGIELFYASHKDRIERRYRNMKISLRPVNLWEHYEFPFKRKGWQSVVFDDTDYEWETLAEDEGGACFWELDEKKYEFTATDGPAYEELPSTDVMGKMEHVVPEMVNGFMTAGHGKKIVIAIDQELGSGWTRKQLRKTMDALSHLALGDDQLSDLLRNVVIRHGKADSLSSGLESLVDRGDVGKENIIIITNETNREAYFKGFEGASTITGIDDEELTDGFYYPLVEIVLFTVARALKYDRENLIRCYRNISNSLNLDDDAIWQRCWDPVTETYRTTMVIKLIPGAVKLPGDRGLYRDIRQYIASRA